MGTVYRGNCKSCGYTEEFALGGGMLGCDLKRNIRFLSEAEQDVLRVMIQKDEVKDFLIENKLTRCTACGNGALKSEVVIRVTDTAGEERIFGIQCRVCGGRLMVYSEDDLQKGRAECPVCKDERLSFDRVGFWD